MQLSGDQLVKLLKASFVGHSKNQLTNGSSGGYSSSKAALQLAATAQCWRRSIVPRTAMLTLSTLALLGARVYVMGSQLPVFTRSVFFISIVVSVFLIRNFFGRSFDNPASASSFPGRHLTYHYLAVVNGWLMAFPSSLCCDWTMGTVTLVDSFLDPRNLATISFYLLLGHFIWSAFIRGDAVVIMVSCLVHKLKITFCLE